MTNEQRPSRQLEIAGIVCVALGILVVIFDGGTVMRVLGGIFIAMGAGALIMKAREVRQRQQAEGMADLRAEREALLRQRAQSFDDDRDEAPVAGSAAAAEAARVPTELGPVDADLAAAAGRTLATLTAHRTLRRLDDSEIAMVAAGVSDAGEADISSVLASLEETAGIAAGDPVSLLNKVEQDEEYFAVLIEGFSALSGMRIGIRDLSVEWPEDGVRPRVTRVRAALDVGSHPLELDVKNWTKYLAPAIPVLLARALHNAGAPRRLAAYALEDAWVISLPDDDAELARLNAELGLPDRFDASFRWLDQDEPTEAD